MAKLKSETSEKKPEDSKKSPAPKKAPTPKKAPAPKKAEFAVGSLVLDHKDRVYTIDDYTKIGTNHMYSIKLSNSDDKLSVKENKLFLWKDPNETWSSYYSRGGTSHVVATPSSQLNKTSMSVKNLTKESISLYFVPEGKCVYKNSLSDFKLMNYIAPGEIKKFHTKIDDAFVCANRECIIKYFKVSKEKEKIEVQL